MFTIKDVGHGMYRRMTTQLKKPIVKKPSKTFKNTLNKSLLHQKEF